MFWPPSGWRTARPLLTRAQSPWPTLRTSGDPSPTTRAPPPVPTAMNDSREHATSGASHRSSLPTAALATLRRRPAPHRVASHASRRRRRSARLVAARARARMPIQPLSRFIRPPTQRRSASALAPATLAARAAPPPLVSPPRAGGLDGAAPSPPSSTRPTNAPHATLANAIAAERRASRPARRRSSRSFEVSDADGAKARNGHAATTTPAPPRRKSLLSPPAVIEPPTHGARRIAVEVEPPPPTPPPIGQALRRPPPPPAGSPPVLLPNL